MLRAFVDIVAMVGGLGIVAVLAAATFVVFHAWRVEASLKASTRGASISGATGLSVAGWSASAAAILDGPGVVAVHFRGRERWRKAVAKVSVDTVIGWLDQLLAASAKESAPRGRLARWLVHAKDWLVPRTNLRALPELGLKLLAELRAPSVRGAVTCGFSDPALTGRAAAVLYPIAGVLSPFGALDLTLDWTGKDVVEADVVAACRVTPARAILASLRFARRHVRRHVPSPSPPPARAHAHERELTHG